MFFRVAFRYYRRRKKQIAVDEGRNFWSQTHKFADCKQRGLVSFIAAY